MTPVFIDLETFWSTEHTLTKMSPIAYCMHPETEVISIAVKFGNHNTDVLFGEDNIRGALSKIDWSDKFVIGHNMSAFDSMILAWRLGVRPKLWGCTLAMARPIYAKQGGVSLKNVAEKLGVGVKDSTALVNTKGKHLKDFTEAELDAMRVYNREDTEMCAAIFKKLAKITSPDELRLIDMTIRMLVEPQFELDTDLLTRTLEQEKANKAEALRTLGDLLHVDETGLELTDRDELVRMMLASNAKFAGFLRDQGVEPPTKVSKTTGKPTLALAKTDEAFIELQEHPNELVAAAARARLGTKSTILETRIQAFLAAGAAVEGRLPVPLNYYGADTTGRWSGWAYNPQNLPRVSGKTSDALRKSLRAPAGHKVVVADLSGIELRVNMFLWQVPYAMELFQKSPDKADLYRYFAAHELYHTTEDEVTKAQRQLAKAAVLGLGFGSGAQTFRNVAKTMGGVTISEAESEVTVRTYRAAHQEVVQGWKTSHAALDAIYRGGGTEIDPWGMLVTTPEGIRTPRGMIRYPGLRKEINDEGKPEWMYGEGRRRARIYGPKVVENVVQSLARCVIADNALAVARTPLMRNYPPALMVHDELVYVVPDEIAEDALATVQEIMRTPPTWWPELVTWSEGDIADTYGDAK